MAEAESTLMRLAMDGGVCSERCPHCQDVNVFTGFSPMVLYTCRHCGTAVEVKPLRQ